MDNFINIGDYDASIHCEIHDALLRKDSASYHPQIIEICENRAIAEMRSYLGKPYDCDAIFAARGDERHQLVLMFALDITIYHIFCQHNPYKISSIREQRYKRAIEWMKGIMNGDITIEGVPLLPEEQQRENSRWQIEADEVRPIMI